MTTPDSVALPDELRVPMDELEADAGYLMGRACRCPHCADAMAESVRVKIRAIRAEVERLAQSAPLAQQREYPPLPVKECAAIWPAILDWYGESPGADTYEKSHAVDQAITAAMRAYVDAALAAAQVDQPSMPSSEWLAEAERIAGEFTVAVANGESAAAALAYSNLRAHLSKRITADAPQLKHAGWFREMPSAMSHRVFEQVHHEPEQGDVELFERVIPADGEVRG